MKTKNVVKYKAAPLFSEDYFKSKYGHILSDDYYKQNELKEIQN